MTDYDIWLFSNQGEVNDYCPDCEAHVDDCLCNKYDDLQQQLTELDAQIETSKVWMRESLAKPNDDLLPLGVREYNQKNGLR